MNPPVVGAPNAEPGIVPETTRHRDPVAVATPVKSSHRELDEERARTQRLLADFANFRRRVGRERETARRDGARDALLPLLPVLDDFERALAAGSVDPGFYEGVVAIHRRFVAALREAGAEPIEAVGQPFDPTVHEAVGTILGDPADAGLIARETRRGWRLGGELLRPARVVVASAPGG
jgi:molecular chaperone GrpE